MTESEAITKQDDWTQSGERQVGNVLDDIRYDHVARYRFAADVLRELGACRVIDIACGVGYGAMVLADASLRVFAVDSFAPAIDYARHHWFSPSIEYHCASAQDVVIPDGIDASVCFETIEHLSGDEPSQLLRKLRRSTSILLASVPNEDVIPFGIGFKHHCRHYTRHQFEALLNSAGWIVQQWYGQSDETSPVVYGMSTGRTIIAQCVSIKDTDDRDLTDYRNTTKNAESPAYLRMVEEFPVPDHVAILGLGPSLEQYVDITKRLGGKHAYADEVWGINAVAGVILCDRVFHMDDVRIQEVRAKASPESNIAKMLQWLRVHPGPVITSREHPDYPGLVAFPLQGVLNSLGQAYFNSTAAYAVAYAIYIGVKRISLFGCDFTYPDSHDAEKGRGCLEFWLGIASARGIRLTVPKTSTLLDGIYQLQDHFYGYDTLAVTLHHQASGSVEVDLQPIDALPTAEELEDRYDHSRHPNKLISG